MFRSSRHANQHRDHLRRDHLYRDHLRRPIYMRLAYTLALILGITVLEPCWFCDGYGTYFAQTTQWRIVLNRNAQGKAIGVQWQPFDIPEERACPECGGLGVGYPYCEWKRRNCHHELP